MLWVVFGQVLVLLISTAADFELKFWPFLVPFSKWHWAHLYFFEKSRLESFNLFNGPIIDTFFSFSNFVETFKLRDDGFMFFTISKLECRVFFVAETKTINEVCRKLIESLFLLFWRHFLKTFHTKQHAISIFLEKPWIQVRGSQVTILLCGWQYANEGSSQGSLISEAKMYKARAWSRFSK